MTKERKLAIKMWQDIKRLMPEWVKLDPDDIVSFLRCYKDKFCTSNKVHWLYDCWLCQYFRDNCEKCPLHSCYYAAPWTAWARIVSCSTNLKTKLAACDEIILALGGKP